MASENDIQFLQYATTIDYPFIGPIVNANLRSLVGDVLVRMVQVFGSVPNYAIRHGLKLGSFTKSGSSISFTFLLANGTTAIDSSTAATTVSQTWGNWKIIEYRHASWSVKLVIDTNVAADFSVTGDDNYYLSARCLEFTPLFIKQFSVNSVLVGPNGAVTNPTPAVRVFNSNVKLQSGFNFRIDHDPVPTVAPIANEAQPQAADLFSKLRFNVIPGAGKGRYSDCAETVPSTPYIQSINGMLPDAKGNLNISGSECYRVERPIHFTSVPPDSNPRQGTITPGELELTGDCGTCTDCDDFYNAYVKLRQVYVRLKAVRDRSEALARQYTHIGRLVDTYNAYVMKPEVRLRFVPSSGNMYTAQLMFRTGALAFDSFQFKILWPTFDGTFKGVNYSAWQRLHGETNKQVSDIIKIGPSVADPGSWLYNFTYTRLFKPHTLHWWSWSFVAEPTATLPAPTVADPVTATINLDWTWVADPHDGGIDPALYNRTSKRQLTMVYPTAVTVNPEVAP